jgi:hypothetical protein
MYLVVLSGGVSAILGSIFGSPGITVMPQMTDGFAGWDDSICGRQFQSTFGGFAGRLGGAKSGGGLNS